MTETTLWLDVARSPSCIPFYDSFGHAWDWFMSAAFNEVTGLHDPCPMLEHETC